MHFTKIVTPATPSLLEAARRILLFAAFLLFYCGRALAQGTSQQLTITFDGPPLLQPGSALIAQSYTEQGFEFHSIASSGFVRVAAGPSAARPDNGTAYLQTLGNQSLVVYRADGALFDLQSVDLAEYSTVVPDAVTVEFIGYFADGSTIAETRRTDGVIDGTGPLADFQTFQFRFWNNLIRVEIPTGGYSLDNLTVGVVPEPASGALILAGGLVLWLVRRRNSAQTPL